MENQIYFIAKIKYSIVNHLGFIVKKNDSFIIEAMSYTDAENILKFNMPDNINSFTISNLSQSKVTEIINNEGKGIEEGTYIEKDKGIYYKVRIETRDDSGASNKYFILVLAENIADAIVIVKNSYKDSIYETEIISIAKTTISEILYYTVEAAEDNILTENLIKAKSEINETIKPRDSFAEQMKIEMALDFKQDIANHCLCGTLHNGELVGPLEKKEITKQGLKDIAETKENVM